MNVMDKQALISITAPASGKLLTLSKVPDPVFSQGLMGQGFAIEPNSSDIVAPVSGTVTLVSDTKHAFGIKTNDGADILVHLGIDTVELKGAPFEVLIKQGDIVTSGQSVVKMNLKMIQDAGKSTTVILAVTNSNDILNDLMITGTSEVKGGQIVAVMNVKETENQTTTKSGNQYDQLATEIIKNVGGAENINSLIHCITRLRFYLKDESKASTAVIENIGGVITVGKAGGQYQVVLGRAVVDVHDAVIKQIGPGFTNDAATAEAVAQTTKDAKKVHGVWPNVKQGVNNFIGVLTASMIPIIGILAGSGILKGILAALTGFKVLSTT